MLEQDSKRGIMKGGERKIGFREMSNKGNAVGLVQNEVEFRSSGDGTRVERRLGGELRNERWVNNRNGGVREMEFTRSGDDSKVERKFGGESRNGRWVNNQNGGVREMEFTRRGDDTKVERKFGGESRNGRWVNNQNGGVREMEFTRRGDDTKVERKFGGESRNWRWVDNQNGGGNNYAQSAQENVRRGRVGKRGYEDSGETDRAAFRSLEEFNDIDDKPRVSRVDMEERIQKLAKSSCSSPVPAALKSTLLDLWSAGCILAELLAGKPIMSGRTEVEQLHKIFKLCGSPSEEYWKKSKLPHATIFRPQQSYKRCIADTFKDFPASSLPRIIRESVKKYIVLASKQDATTGENNAIPKKKKSNTNAPKPRPKKKKSNTNSPKPTDVINAHVPPVVTDGHVTQPQPSVNAGESQAVQQVLQNDPNDPMAYLLQLINNLMGEAWDYLHVTHIPETANAAALALANHCQAGEGGIDQFNHAPSAVRGIVEEEMRG
ncbi:hypothetical protein POM88_034638 [Heracleum sosnowskyi]|uniref:Uncharacterized protein n=1 Tax=Heracleum sosnowskyi TaxID=360622 RepID=A0AAD8HKY5_9APIA|nr:hypothetical protein POM88_034638 [Heracleum sosnowskyi]